MKFLIFLLATVFIFTTVCNALHNEHRRVPPCTDEFCTMLCIEDGYQYGKCENKRCKCYRTTTVKNRSA
ncbi:unnamed protein product [Bursaphelenchus xylophilus]|uniref:(pine wood nematode) hypothetical protein n=1 Tax=Bursaphelenchus xylophilus TaxID=6326 RepID=A0A1I7RUV8_BURXY|nr:unnamed protein product [Bursaphelenchus xylophilus]CAG9105378.1 unnamed protein product [Bursaphelenchus xylophilus]